MAEVKFCGLTRAADAAFGSSIGAAFVGAIFAGGPRLLTAAGARTVFEAAASAGRARRVGVFGSQGVEEMLAVALETGLDVVQLHGTSQPAVVRQLRRHFGGEVWRVLRLRGELREQDLALAAEDVDALVVDAFVGDMLGGTGVPVDWDSLALTLERSGRPPRLVLAGGLRPDNVARAIELVAPDVVDVSSGVESAPGIKDQALMRAFAEAARGGR
ncbi:MAG: phosphoribosylanthranilate isomerase [Gemmatimonadota bacterium]